MRRAFPTFLIALALVFAARGQIENALPSTPTHEAGSQFGAIDAIILGLIEGVTEFLPISSTGHLIIARDVMRLNSNQPLFDANGQALWYREASATHGSELLTLNLATDTYIYVIQFGAVAAVAMVCWPQLMSMLWGVLGRDPAGLRLLVNVMIAFLPAAIMGLLFHDWIDEHLFSVGAVIFAQVAGALLMFYAEFWYGRRYVMGIRPTTTEISPIAAAGIGVLQCIAMWPGTSRPMMAIVGGYFAGLDPKRSAEFSFLLGFVTLTAASVYKSVKSGPAMLQVFGWPQVALGAAVAAITAFFCVRWFMNLLLRYGLNGFAWYRIALAAGLFFYF